ncbi:MAG: excalibur calcium-binding domain-containing protein [Gammaproteobacteria bacterium]
MRWPPTILLLLFPAVCPAHGGGLDAYGCHLSRKHRGYQCHRGPMAGSSFASKAEMLQELEGARSLPAQSLTGEMAGGCGAKTLCKQMLTCEEAMHYLNDCGLTRLDRDGDGVPCESICR